MIDPSWKWTGYTFRKEDKDPVRIADALTFDNVQWEYKVEDNKLYTRPTPKRY